MQCFRSVLAVILIVATFIPRQRHSQKEPYKCRDSRQDTAGYRWAGCRTDSFDDNRTLIYREGRILQV